MNEQLILGRYRLLDRLALGGTAEVWRAHDRQLDRLVAVKRLHAHLLPDEASRKRLAAEARAAAQLSHPVIVQIYDVDTDVETPAIVMELVDGEPLATRLARDGRLDAATAALIAADVSDALYHAHQRGVVHRDVKPGNVLLSVDGTTRLVDFGIARSLAESAERLTLTGTVIGTLSAMAPEQLTGDAVGPRTDLYGVGAVLYEAVTARPPYGAASPVAVAQAQRAGPPDLSGVDPDLAAIIRSCLAYDPADRPLHAGELARALRAWVDGDRRGAMLAAPPSTASASVDTQALTVAAPMVAVAAETGDAADAPAPRSWLSRVVVPAGAAVAAVAVAVAMLTSGVGRDGGGGVISESPRPSAAQPTTAPAAVPEWLTRLVDDLSRRCNPDIVAAAEAQMATFTEDEAKAYADEVKKACEGGDERGGGNGGGGENGRGRGNDD